MSLHAGQCWTYRAPSGYETSRIIIGAIVTFDGDRSIVLLQRDQRPTPARGRQRRDRNHSPFCP